ncbi:hypothetical protein B0H14DRAFT_1428909 [Mycena olivaceomarginata]|nr:hypothetical protein B0H14DRAFT_1428909 [Mycena olivaceomarginata]
MTPSTPDWNEEFTSKFRRSQQGEPLLPSVTQIERMLFGDESVKDQQRRSEQVLLSGTQQPKRRYDSNPKDAMTEESAAKKRKAVDRNTFIHPTLNNGEDQRHGDHHPVLLHGESTDVLGLGRCDCTKRRIVSECEPSPARTLLSSTQSLSSSECLYSRDLAQIPPPITPLLREHLRHQLQLLPRPLPDVLKDCDGVSGAPMLQPETRMHRPKRAVGGGPARGGSLRRRGRRRRQDRRE